MTFDQYLNLVSIGLVVLLFVLQGIKMLRKEKFRHDIFPSGVRVCWRKTSFLGEEEDYLEFWVALSNRYRIDYKRSEDGTWETISDPYELANLLGIPGNLPEEVVLITLTPERISFYAVDNQETNQRIPEITSTLEEYFQAISQKLESIQVKKKNPAEMVSYSVQNKVQKLKEEASHPTFIPLVIFMIIVLLLVYQETSR